MYPKSELPFKAHPRLSQKLPFVLGETVEHAIREHQWCGKYKTSGVSCTKDLEIASQKYFGEGVVVEIDESRLAEYGIKAYTVKDWIDVEFIECPDDDEVILVYEGSREFPKDILSVIIDKA